MLLKGPFRAEQGRGVAAIGWEFTETDSLSTAALRIQVCLSGFQAVLLLNLYILFFVWERHRAHTSFSTHFLN